MTREEYIAAAVAAMAAATWSPTRWANAIQNGYGGKPYNYKAARNWEAQTAPVRCANGCIQQVES